MSEATDPIDDRPPSPLPVISRKPVVKSNSMKRSSTYFPSNDVNVGRATTLQPERVTTLSHRRSQSATFLSQLISAKSNHFKAADKASDFSKTKKTVFDTEVISANFPFCALAHFFPRYVFFPIKVFGFRGIVACRCFDVNRSAGAEKPKLCFAKIFDYNFFR